MKITTEDLKRFGLDRYGVMVKTTKTDGGTLAYKTETFPIHDDETCQQVQDDLNQLIEPDAMKATAFMLVDGSFAMTGFKPEMRGHLHAIIESGRAYYKGRLELMENEAILESIASWTIDQMILHGVDHDATTFEFSPIDRRSLCLVDVDQPGGNDKRLKINLPTAHSSITNADFLTWWQAKIRARYDAIMIEMIDNKLSEARLQAQGMLRNVERLERIYDSRREARTNPAGIQRPMAGSSTLN